jgi:hypothetical protein
LLAITLEFKKFAKAWHRFVQTCQSQAAPDHGLI